jgi:tetratricopeptide (TPR) repeat protein
MPSHMLFASVALAVVAQAGAPRPLSDNLRRAEAQRHFNAGQESMYEEAFERAVREFRAAIELDPLIVLAHYNLGQAHMALKQYPDAAKPYLGCRDTIEQLSSLKQSEMNIREREINDQVNDLKDVIRRLRNERTRDPGNRIMMVEERIRVLEGTRSKGNEDQPRVPAELYLALGSAYFRQGIMADAEREYGEAVEANPKLGPAHNNLAVIYMLTGRFKEAHEAVRKAEKAGFSVNPNLKKDLATREARANTQ